MDTEEEAIMKYWFFGQRAPFRTEKRLPSCLLNEDDASLTVLSLDAGIGLMDDKGRYVNSVDWDVALYWAMNLCIKQV